MNNSYLIHAHMSLDQYTLVLQLLSIGGLNEHCDKILLHLKLCIEYLKRHLEAESSLVMVER
jgi:hypothetical protein